MGIEKKAMPSDGIIVTILTGFVILFVNFVVMGITWSWVNQVGMFVGGAMVMVGWIVGAESIADFICDREGQKNVERGEIGSLLK